MLAPEAALAAFTALARVRPVPTAPARRADVSATLCARPLTTVTRGVHRAPVAQPDRVVASEAIGRGFESLQARHPGRGHCTAIPPTQRASASSSGGMANAREVPSAL